MVNHPSGSIPALCPSGNDRSRPKSARAFRTEIFSLLGRPRLSINTLGNLQARLCVRKEINCAYTGVSQIRMGSRFTYALSRQVCKSNFREVIILGTIRIPGSLLIQSKPRTFCSVVALMTTLTPFAIAQATLTVRPAPEDPATANASLELPDSPVAFFFDSTTTT